MGLYFVMLDQYQLILCLDACLTGLGVFMVSNVMSYPILKISVIIQ